LGAVLTSWVGHELLDVVDSIAAGFEATRTGSGLNSGLTSLTTGFVAVNAGVVLGAFVTLVAGFVLGLELPKNESKSEFAVETALPPKLESVFETVWVSGVDFSVVLLSRPRCPKGLFRVLAVGVFATFAAALRFLSRSSRILVLATVSFLFSQVNGSGSDDVTFTDLFALTRFKSVEA